MIALLKKFGVQVTLAGIVSAMVAFASILFTVDERYAKAKDLEAEVEKLENINAHLNRELAQVVGFQQAMTAFISEGRIPGRTIGGMTSTSPAQRDEPIVLMSPPPPPPSVEETVVETPTASADPLSAEVPPSTPVEEVKQRPQIVLEVPNNWKELAEGLQRQQSRIAK